MSCLCASGYLVGYAFKLADQKNAHPTARSLPRSCSNSTRSSTVSNCRTKYDRIKTCTFDMVADGDISPEGDIYQSHLSQKGVYVSYNSVIEVWFWESAEMNEDGRSRGNK